jgi:hypothetical protein
MKKLDLIGKLTATLRKADAQDSPGIAALIIKVERADERLLEILYKHYEEGLKKSERNQTLKWSAGPVSEAKGSSINGTRHSASSHGGTWFEIDEPNDPKKYQGTKASLYHHHPSMHKKNVTHLGNFKSVKEAREHAIIHHARHRKKAD